MKLEILVSRKYRFTEDWPIRDSKRDDTSLYSIYLGYRCTTTEMNFKFKLSANLKEFIVFENSKLLSNHIPRFNFKN